METVELVYIPLNGEPVHLHLQVPTGTTAKEAIHRTGLQEKYPEVASLPIGIFSKPISPDTVLKTGDRIEIYRPLLVDPKEKRRQRARRNG
ncbi:RnfH family protein [Legionella septentrionalis]|uniref:RnfH family protein n=1 Tax=Legionella septentrionalis TaxID=2498109 RepID=UPI000F8E6B4F|nr:RnfH family protein [Legionella septentrionalis]RUQ98699.1 RnfH family protein [Legionella septentrionalis]